MGARPRPVAGVATLAVMLASAVVGVTLMAPALLLLAAPGGRRPAHAWLDTVFRHWTHLVILCLERLGGVKFVIWGQVPARPVRPTLVLSNHRCRIDWLFLWALFHRCRGGFPSLKIVLKQELKFIPYLGWAMQLMRFIFLRRRWEDDFLHIADMCEYYRRHTEPAAVLIFPEGTDLHPAALEKSDAFAAARGLPKLRRVLHPRAQGARHVLRSLDGPLHKAGGEIWDLTVAYRDAPPGPAHERSVFLEGAFPREVHFLVESVKSADVPRLEDGFAEWIEQRFQRKEKLLERFAREPREGFDVRREGPRRVEDSYVSCVAFWVAGSAVFCLALSTLWGRVFCFSVAALFVGANRLWGGIHSVLWR